MGKIEKPIIIICGAPHSMTSMISNFLLDNGAATGEIYDEPLENIQYSRYEDKVFKEYVRGKMSLKPSRLDEYFDKFPTAETVILKMPMSAYFLDDIKNYTKRKLKVVYVLRNPQNVILSSMEKTGKDFIYFFNRYISIYAFCATSDLEIFPVMAERIAQKKMDHIKRLLDFCELKPANINLNSLNTKMIKSRKANYFKYRFSNFWWKVFTRILKLY